MFPDFDEVREDFYYTWDKPAKREREAKSTEIITGPTGIQTQDLLNAS